MTTVLKDGKQIGLVEIELWLAPEKVNVESGDVYVFAKDGEKECCYISPNDMQILRDIDRDPNCLDALVFSITGGLLNSMNEEGWESWMKKHPYGVFYEYNENSLAYHDITEKVQYVKCCASPEVYNAMLEKLESSI